MNKKNVALMIVLVILVIPCLGQNPIAIVLSKTNSSGLDVIVGEYAIAMSFSPNDSVTVYKNKQLIELKQFSDSEKASDMFTNYVLKAASEAYTEEAKGAVLGSYVAMQQEASKLIKSNPTGTVKGLIIAAYGAKAGFARMGNNTLILAGSQVKRYSFTETQQRSILKEMMVKLNSLDVLPSLQMYLEL